MAVALERDAALLRSAAGQTGVAPLPTMPVLSFGELVRRYRIAKGLTQDQLAELAGTDGPYISGLERDPDLEPGHDLARRLIRALKAPPEPFLVALEYLPEKPSTDKLAAVEEAIITSDLPDDRKQTALMIVQLLFAQGDRRAG